MISLSRKVSEVLPRSVIAGGVAYKINPDFRNVLACLRVLSDPERQELHKVLYIVRHFYCGHPPPDMGRLFGEFISGGEAPDDDREQLMDFELDAGAIYASFRQQYGINLLTESLHWYEFRALLQGLCEDTPFGQRVRIRGLDVNDVPEKERGKLRKIKDMLAIKPKMSKAEAELRAELERRLDAGEDPADIINSLQGV